MSLNAPSSVPAPTRRTVPLALFAVVVLVVTGAGIAVTAAYFETRPAPTPAGSTPITDDEGRTVAVPANPQRVVVLAPSIMDSMVRLGLRDRVVGVDCGLLAAGGLSTDYNDSQITAWNLSTSMCIGTEGGVDIPAVLNASPDLVLASTIISVSDVEEMSTTYGLPVLLLQPLTLGGIEVDVTLLGQIFGVPTRAAALVGQMQGVLGSAQTIVTNLGYSGLPLPTVLLTYYASPADSPSPGYWSYGPGTFGESLIEFIGAASASANSTLPYPEIPGSVALASDPQIILYGTGFGVTLSTYQQGPQWGELDAVTSGHAYGIDSNLITEPDPTMILDGLPVLFDLVHPGMYPPA